VIIILFFALCLELDKNCRPLQHNLLSGSIPAQLAALTALQTWSVHPTQQVAIITFSNCPESHELRISDPFNFALLFHRNIDDTFLTMNSTALCNLITSCNVTGIPTTNCGKCLSGRNVAFARIGAQAYFAELTQSM
jgi:hypothetical protein